MYYLLSEKEKELIKKIEKETNTKYLSGDMLQIESMMSIIEDLKNELDVQKEKYEDLEQNMQDNYKLKSPSELYF